MQAARGASLNSSEEATSGPAAPRGPSTRRTFALVALGAWMLDLVTKTVAVDQLTGRGTVELLGSWFGFHLTRNPGAAFSTGSGFTVLLSCVAIGAALFVLYLSRKLASTWWAVGLGFLLGGVLGNLTDRLFREPGPFRGHVVDFLQLPNWPIFNVADICINIAAAVIVLQTVRGIGLDGRRHD